MRCNQILRIECVKYGHSVFEAKRRGLSLKYNEVYDFNSYVKVDKH